MIKGKNEIVILEEANGGLGEGDKELARLLLILADEFFKKYYGEKFNVVALGNKNSRCNVFIMRDLTMESMCEVVERIDGN